MVFFRKYYGSLLAALCHNWKNTYISCGMNQYSIDLQQIYDYLNSKFQVKGYIAGDYKGFDRHMRYEMRLAAYNIIERLAGSIVPPNVHKYLYAHECLSGAQIDDLYFNTNSYNMSGCFFTTAVNCIVNDMYFRYIWKRIYPDLCFDRHVRAVYLGDDHVLAVGHEVPEFNPKRVGLELSKINQVYTSTDKVSELTEELCEFGNLTYLGSQPVQMMIYDSDTRFVSWCGRMKWSTITETLHWQKGLGEQFESVVREMIGYAAFWPEYYDQLLEDIKKVYSDLVEDEIREPRLSKVYRVANRTTDKNYVFFGAQAPMIGSNLITGLTGISPPQVIGTYNSLPSRSHLFLDSGIGSKKADINFGTDSFVFRTNLTWNTTQAYGTILASYEVPKEILSLGGSQNAQNMPFDKFIYFHSNLELMFQISGSQFQCGRLIVAFVEGVGKVDAVKIQVDHLFFGPHITLSPNDNTSAILKIPFSWFRTCMNTFAMSFGQEMFGTVIVAIQTPLTVSTDQTTAIVSMYSSFPGARFAHPRPYLTAQGNTVSNVKNRYNYEFNRGSKIGGNVPLNLHDEKMSKVDMTGPTVNVPVEVGLGSAIPMDAPNVNVEPIPTVPVQPSLSNTSGPRLTHRMDMAHCLIDTHHISMEDPNETNIASLCGRFCYLRSVEWNVSDVENTEIWFAPLNSILYKGSASPYTTAWDIPPNLGILNLFQFWRANIVLEFRAIKTHYHSGRLALTVGYGAPETYVTPASRLMYRSEILDFSEDSSIQSVVIPYESANSYLMTYKGPGFNNAVQDFSLGHIMVTVANCLRAVSTVPTTIWVDVFISLRDVEVFESNTCGAVEFRFDPTDTGHAIYKAQGSKVVDVEEHVDTHENVEPKTLLPVNTAESTIPYALSERKYPYLVRDVLELVRRYYRVFIPWKQITLNLNGATSYVYLFPVTFQHMLANLYARWAGSLNYIIYNIASNSWLDEYGFTPSTELKYDSEVLSLTTLGGKNIVGNVIQTQPWYTIENFGTTTLCIRQGLSSASVSREIPVTSGQARYLSIQIPFNTIYETLPTMPYRMTTTVNMGVSDISSKSSISPIIGYMWFLTRRTTAMIGSNLCFYQSVGDDFRLYGVHATTTRFLPYLDASGLSNPGTQVTEEFRF
jgi:hypothetical protein